MPRNIICEMAIQPGFVELVAEPRDHLTSLPSELQHMIIGYLFATHEPDKAFDSDIYDIRKSIGASHPLDFLAATCRSLRGEIMQWSLHFHTQHQDLTKYTPLKTAKLQARRNLLRGRGGLLTWSEKNCVFCGKTSTRSAILMNGFRCCNVCDKQQWPDKITKSDAKKKYDLKDNHLLPHHYHSPSAAKLLAKHPGGMPKMRYGTSMSSNVPTTMFLEKDVEALAVLAHGDLVAHLAKRQADREERSRKLKATKAKKEADAARLPQEVVDYFVQKLYGSSAEDPVVLSGDNELDNLAAESASWLGLEGTATFMEDDDFTCGVWAPDMF